MPRKRVPFSPGVRPVPPVAERRPNAYRRGYTKEWSRYTKRFLHGRPLCAACEAEGRIVPATQVDHIVPHQGDHELFWDPANHQPLCTSCHSRKTCTHDGGFGRPREGRKTKD